MPLAEEQQTETVSPPAIDPDFQDSLLKVMEEIVHQLPDEATLGDLIDQTRKSREINNVLKTLTVQQLIDMAKTRAEARQNGEADAPEIIFDEEGNPILSSLDSGPAVVRRRADVPDGDIRVLRCLAEEGPLNEGHLGRQTRLTAEQVRLIVRHLRTKGHIHIEGSGVKRKIKITRNGSGYLRRNR
jgi:hypothetical protein